MPTLDSPDQEVEDIYSEIGRIIIETPYKERIILLGDFIAKILNMISVKQLENAVLMGEMKGAKDYFNLLSKIKCNRTLVASI